MNRLDLKKFPAYCNQLDIITDRGQRTHFRLNFLQNKAVSLILKAIEKRPDRPLWIIVLKSRQVGMSTMIEALMTYQLWASPHLEDLVVAHVKTSAKSIFDKAVTMRDSFGEKFNMKLPVATLQKLQFPHSSGPSTLTVQTAGSGSQGRGLTLHGLHLSESAFVKEDSYQALLNAIHPSSMSLLAMESTANGKVGTGATFYQFWQDAITSRNDYIPVFLSWKDDPDCLREPGDWFYMDQDDYAFMNEFRLTREQMAWRQWTMNTKCGGSPELFNVEYPVTPDIAFTFTGMPAFSPYELEMARSSVEDPIERCEIKWDDDRPALYYDERTEAGLWIWETPISGHQYVVGVDTARGEKHGDFAACSVWDCHSGNQVASYMKRVAPLFLVETILALGTYYKEAIVNIELNAGGKIVLDLLRDKFHYPNFYKWRGRDDKIFSSQSTNPTIGWETTYRSREFAMTVFRQLLSANRIRVRDARLQEQMGLAERGWGSRWEVEEGNDDLLMASFLAVVALYHNPVDFILNPVRNTEDVEEGPPIEYALEPHRMVTRHFERLKNGKPRTFI